MIVVPIWHDILRSSDESINLSNLAQDKIRSSEQIQLQPVLSINNMLPDIAQLPLDILHTYASVT